MTTLQDHVSRCTVYSGRGVPHVTSTELAPAEPLPDRAPVADRVSLSTIMSRDLVCARPDLEIGAVVGLMMRHHLGCVPIVDERCRPIGVITKLDVCEQVDAAMQATSGGSPLPSSLVAQTADDVMMPIALTLREDDSIAHAAAMMMAEDTHHVLAVSRTGVLVGVVSAKDIVGWVVKYDVLATRRDASCGPPIWQPFEA